MAKVLAVYLLFALVGGVLLGRTLPLLAVSLEPAPALAFDEERAYALLARLVTEHPGRVSGTPADEAAARWVGDELRALGATVTEQRFQAFGAGDLKDWRWHDGINVLGASRGSTDAVILFGAHRDVVPMTGQGADDNGSGTATMLELARVLSATPHRYTYLFVSFGAEEVGLGGSAYLAAYWPALPGPRLVVNLDMLGWRDAASVRVDHWTYLPLPATSVLAAMADRSDGAVRLGAAKTLWQVAGLVEPSSDSAPFVLRGVPGLFFHDGPPQPGAHGHCYHVPCDDLGQVSAAALGRTGRFVEELVRRVEANGDLLEGPRAFMVRDHGYVPEWQVRGLGVLGAVLAVALLALAADEVRRRGCLVRVYGQDAPLRTATPFWLGASGAAMLVALTAPLPGLGATPDGPRVLAWVALALLVTLGLGVLRGRGPAQPPAGERLLLTAMLVLGLGVAALATNLLLAGLAALPHLLLSTRVRLRTAWRSRLVDLAIVLPGCLWSAAVLAMTAGVGLFQLLPVGPVLAGIALGYLGVVVPPLLVLRRGRAYT